MGLYRPTVTRKRKDGTRTREKSPLWWGNSQNPITRKWLYVALKTRDKSAAQIRFNEAQRKAARGEAGLLDPFEEHRKRPLAEHIAVWKASLLARGVTVRQVELVTERARKVFEGSSCEFWHDLTASKVELFVGDLRTRGLKRLPQKGLCPRKCGMKTRTRNFLYSRG